MNKYLLLFTYRLCNTALVSRDFWKNNKRKYCCHFPVVCFIGAKRVLILIVKSDDQKKSLDCRWHRYKTNKFLPKWSQQNAHYLEN